MANKKRPPLLLSPGKGRRYAMGAIRAVFKADGRETARRYSISEWWLEPRTPGPGAHSHGTEDDVFYVIEGTAHFLLGKRWIRAPRGTFVCAPAGVTHDFANRTNKKVGILNFSIPGGFEDDMSAIVQRFRENR